jgi:cysteinyl-tRNA synthetase
VLEKILRKKNPTDFALGNFHQTKEKTPDEWPSPWGIGSWLDINVRY